MQKSIFLKFFYEMEDKIILKFKTKNILNFYEIEPWSCKLQGSISKTSLQIDMQNFVTIFCQYKIWLTSNKSMTSHFHQNLRFYHKIYCE